MVAHGPARPTVREFALDAFHGVADIGRAALLGEQVEGIRHVQRVAAAGVGGHGA